MVMCSCLSNSYYKNHITIHSLDPHKVLCSYRLIRQNKLLGTHPKETIVPVDKKDGSNIPTWIFLLTCSRPHQAWDKCPVLVCENTAVPVWTVSAAAHTQTAFRSLLII